MLRPELQLLIYAMQCAAGTHAASQALPCKTSLLLVLMLLPTPSRDPARTPCLLQDAATLLLLLLLLPVVIALH
jgi:hypothetical protein